MPTPTDRFADARAWALETVGSSRSSGLLRIALALVLWARFSTDLLLYKDLTWRGFGFTAGFFLATTLMLVGYQSRVASAVSGVIALGFVGLNPPGRNWSHHHTYILAFATLLVALTPCDRSLSVDRWLAQRAADRRNEPWPEERGNLFGLRLIVFQLATMYFWTAIDKLKVNFMKGDRLEHYLVAFYTPAGLPKIPGLHALMAASATLTVALELWLAFGLFFARTRRISIVLGLLLHGLFFVFLPVSTYSVTMAALYLAALDADRFHAFLDRWMGHGRPGTASGGGLERLPRVVGDVASAEVDPDRDDDHREPEAL